MEYDFFLSYSRDTYNDFSSVLFQDLRDLGLQVWIDKLSVSFGENIYENLFYFMEESKNWCGVIIVFDKSYFNKAWCLLELDFFIKHEIYIYPILYNMTKEDIPEKYHLIKYLDRITLKSTLSEEYETLINKILDVYVNQSMTREFKTQIINTEIYRTLVYTYKYSNKNDPITLIHASNISTYLENISKQSNDKQLVDYYVLAQIVRVKAKKLYMQLPISSHDLKIVEKIIHFFIEKIFLLD